MPRPSSGPGPRSGRAGSPRRTRPSGRRTSGSRRPSPTASAGSTAPAHFADQIAGARGVRRRASATTASRRRSSPGWAAAASPRTSSADASARIEGWLELRVLDSTDPAGVVRDSSTTSTRSRRSGSSPASPARRPSRTPSSPTPGSAPSRPSGARGAKRYEHPGEFIVAVTDPGKSVEAIPHHDDFREVFLNPPDIGGRYSALTYVGLVPASLIGIDLDAAARVRAGDARRLPRAGPGDEPGRLARARDRDAREGRPRQADVPRRRRRSRASARGLEQLIAESTGKHGVGHRPGRPRAARRRSRPTARTACSSASRSPTRTARARPPRATRSSTPRRPPATRSSGSTSPTRSTSAPSSFRWEVATAIAGAVLGIDPFDQPNVEEAKDLTRKVLAGASDGERPAAPPPPLVARLRDRADAVRRRAAAPDGGRRRRSSASSPATSPGASRTPTSPSRRSSRRSDAATRRCDRIRALLRDATALRDDRRLRAALPPLDRPAPQGRRADRLVPPAHRGPPGRPADPRLAVHVRPAHRRPGRGRLRGARVPRPADPAGPPRPTPSAGWRAGAALREALARG